MAWAMGVTVTSPQHAPSPHLERFRQRIADNATGWSSFVRERGGDVAALEREFPNLARAVEQALLEPRAHLAGLELTVALWPFVEQRGHWLTWQRILRDALAVARRLRRPALEAQLLDQSGELARILGDSRRGLVLQEQALALYGELGDRIGRGRVLTHLSMQHIALGDHPAADRCSREAEQIFAEAGRQAELAGALNNRGLVCQHAGQWEAALELHRRAAALYEALGDRRSQAKAIHNLGEDFRQLRRLAEAADCFQQAAAMHVAVGDEINAARSRMSAGIILHATGQTEAALAVHREVEPLFRRLGDRPWLARAVNNQGVFLAALGRVDEAAAAYAEATELHLTNGDGALAASTQLNWAELLLDNGRPAEARSHLAQAEALLAALPTPPAWVLRTYETLKQRLTDAPASAP